MPQRGVLLPNVGAVNRRFGESLLFRFRRYSSLAVALTASLLVHLAAVWFMDDSGSTLPQRGSKKEARLQVALGTLEGGEAAGVVGDSLSGSSSSIVADQPHGTSFSYVSPGNLSSRPLPLEDIELDVPETLSLSGKVRLILFIGIDGVVERAELAESRLPEAYGAVAVAAFLNRRFSPGRIGTKAVPTFIQLEVEFNPLD